MKKHANIPIFIPHEGCPNACVFCNQHTITSSSDGADRDIRSEIDAALATFSGRPEDVQIAFFGGSFTGIDRDVMTRLLDDAYGYVRDGKVDSIRLSTRPDYISDDILDILKNHGVKSIELGIQSMSDKVLTASGRGHTARCTKEACKRIVQYGFELVGQMMLGLPESSLEDELDTARGICDMGACGTRIYPTVVFENTALCQKAKDGAYTPLTVEEAVRRGAAVYGEFVKRGVSVLRIGLQDTDALHGSAVYAGANHSALGECIVSAFYCQALLAALQEHPVLLRAHMLTILCAPGEESKVAGQKKSNKERLTAVLAQGGNAHCKMRICADEKIAPNTVRIFAEP